ncbi:MAG: TRAP transporter large permease [Proteobacteria bacterium]|nr:TRAP transporter large permease [Pseudomonadota bacterium]
MDATTLSLLAAAAVLVPLMVLGVQIGVTLGLTGMVGIFVYSGGNLSAALSQPLIQGLDVGLTYAFIVIPLFIALGTMAGQSGITYDLFTAFSRWVGHIPGGIAVATIGTSAGLASITGSSVGASAAMAKLAMPELRRFKYDDRMSAGAVSMGGTVAAMIPPSITMVLYGIFAEVSIGKMLIAGVLPGLLTSALYAFKIWTRCMIAPRLGPPGPRFPWRERLGTVPPVVPFFVIVGAVIGGILFGIWTPVESAAGGMVMVLLLGLLRRQMSWRRLFFALTDAAIICASVEIIVVGALIFSNFLVLSGFSELVAKSIIAFDLPPLTMFTALVVIYLIIGMFMEVTSTLALTIPLVMPIVQAMGWDPVWFGVVLVSLMEVGMVTPPVGLCLYVVKAAVPDLTLADICMGALPFWLVNLVAIYLLYMYPVIALVLPNMM